MGEGWYERKRTADGFAREYRPRRMKQLVLGKRTFFVFDWKATVVYFRIFGYGLWLGSHRRFPPLFSERYGRVRAFHFKDYCLRVLTDRTVEV